MSSPPPSVSTASPEEVLRRLDLSITRRLDGMLHGDYRGLVPGHGSEQGETRAYAAGDDVRRIDWNVTARMQEPYVRESIADRELETWVLIDLSPSLDFGTALCEKRDLAVAAAAAVGFLTARTGNRVGAVILGRGARPVTVPARSGRNHLMALLHRLVTAARHDGPHYDGTGQGGAGGSTPTDLDAGIRRLDATVRRRGLAVVVSDFLPSAPASDWSLALRALAARHEVLAVEVVDPRELVLPDVGSLALVDAETGHHRQIHTSPALRSRYAEAAASQRADTARQIRRAGADHLVLRTDRDWLLDLVRFVARRRERAQRLARSRP
ncbi:DUF58 domain-containing protein [soil metagenome]